MTRKPFVYLWAVLLAVGLGAVLVADHHEDAADHAGSYDIRATAIEACSCPLFCSCYYNPTPTGGHHCEFNLAYKFEEGSHYGDTDLSDAKVWLSGDLGGHFGGGKTKWAVVTFDNATTEAQRAAIGKWIFRVFDVEWAEEPVMRTDDITWNDGEEVAHAKMASGMAEVELRKVLDKDGNQAKVSNTGYWFSDSNEGFLLAHSTHHFNGEKYQYEYDNHNGFMITSHVSGEVAPEPQGEQGTAE